MNCPLLQRSPWYCTLFLTAFLSGCDASVTLEKTDNGTQSRSSFLVLVMDAKEHLYKVLVIGEYGVGESYAVSSPLSLKHDQPSLIAASFFFRKGKQCD